MHFHEFNRQLQRNGNYRPDVCAAVGNVPGCPNVGYSWQIDTHILSNGIHNLTVTSEASNGSTASSSRTFSVANVATGSGYQSSITGCTGGAVSDCWDPIPATFLGGSWLEVEDGTYPSEWTLTANNGTIGGSGTVSGYVWVFPLENNYNCAVVTYTVSGSFSTPPLANGVEGYTNYTWVASNPSPAGACDGYVPVSSQTFQGTVFNKGNDTAANNWTSSNGLTGSDTLETNLIFIPTGENLTDAGWGMSGNAVTQFNYVQTLVDSSTYDPSDPNFHKFQGRQIYETGTGTGSDGCYNAAASILGSAPAVLQFYIAGAIWNVGASGSSGYSGNTYLFDTVGYDLARVDYYRTNFPSILPCSTTLQQTMEIVNNVPGQPSADTSSGLNHTLTATIGPNYVSVSKDSHSEILYR